jgi:HD-like signal output (HDOD) protein
MTLAACAHTRQCDKLAIRAEFFSIWSNLSPVSPVQIVFLLLAVVALMLALVFGLFRLKRAPAPATESSAAAAPPSIDTLPTRPPAAAVTPDEPVAELAARQDAMRRLRLLALSSELPPISADSALEDIAAKIRWTLATITDKPNYAPRRPMLLPKLVAAMNDDDVSRRELTGIIATDPALVGALLKLVNSPYYRTTAAPIESLDRAVALLGIEGMRALVAAALMQPVFQLDRSGFPLFGEITWAHTLSSAGAAESHAVMLESSDPFAAQLLALVAGLASIVIFRVAIDEYQSRQVQPDPRTLAALLDSQTAIVARQICGSWQLSERMDAAFADQTELPEGKITSLGRSLQFGHFLGALAVLHDHQQLDETEVEAALQTGDELAQSYQRIWNRRRTQNGTNP